MKILIVVDMQNDFIDMALGTPEAQAIVPNVKAKVKQYIENGDKVIYTRDTHFENYLETQEGKRLPYPHCIKYSEGWQIRPEVYEFGCPIVDKITFGYSAWYSYFSLIDCKNLESIEIVGLCTDICVISNAMLLKASFPETPISVDSSCCAGVTPASHKNALEAMKTCQIDII